MRRSNRITVVHTLKKNLFLVLHFTFSAFLQYLQSFHQKEILVNFIKQLPRLLWINPNSHTAITVNWRLIIFSRKDNNSWNLFWKFHNLFYLHQNSLNRIIKINRIILKLKLKYIYICNIYTHIKNSISIRKTIFNNVETLNYLSYKDYFLHYQKPV